MFIVMMRKAIFIGLFFVALPMGLMAQEALKADTIRTELQSEFLETVGDSTDLVVAGDGTSNWFISLSVSCWQMVYTDLGIPGTNGCG